MKITKKALVLLLVMLIALSSFAFSASAYYIPPKQSIPFAQIAATSTLPVINVNIENGEPKEKEVKDLKQNAELEIVNTNGKGKNFFVTKTPKADNPAAFDYPLTIKGRGNSSWGMPTGKKPYALKFASKTDMLGMGKEKNWCLIPSWMDTTFMRNYLAYKLYKQIDPNGVDCELVELCINGVYEGIYLLTEKVELKDGNRLTFAEAGEDVTGDGEIVSFLLEADVTGYSEPNNFTTSSGVLIVPKEPEDGDYEPAVMTSSMAYIHSFMNQVDNAILSGGDYESLIDVDSFINLYIANELLKNPDYGFGYQPYYSSTFMHVREGGKLHFGVLWDADISLARSDYNNPTEQFRDTLSPTGWLSRNTKWTKELLQDPAFEARVKQRWQQVGIMAESLLNTTLPEGTALLSPIQARDFQVWEAPSARIGWSFRTPLEFNDEVAHMTSFLQNRIEWLNGEWGIPYVPLALDSISSDKTGTVPPKTQLTWQAKTSGGTEPILYKFQLLKGNETLAETAYQSEASYSYLLTENGEYRVNVSAKDAEGEIVSGTSETIKVEALHITSLEVDEATGGITVTASGGAKPYRYSYYVLKSGQVLASEAYSASNQFTFLPEEGESYSLRVYVDDEQGVRVGEFVVI
ncbi:MAG: CotH kinase family protein [Oscillospiraceae bacterium]|jgi:hypothetical protein|nr:CotH kinase family protein [Oscillospiraceae bacterium]